MADHNQNDLRILSALGFQVLRHGDDAIMLRKLDSGTLEAQVTEIVRGCQGLIAAIRHYKYATGTSLRVAKETVEQIVVDEGYAVRSPEGSLNSVTLRAEWAIRLPESIELTYTRV